MAKTKFGVGDKVSTDTGFTPYEGPLPKPGVIYPVTQRKAVMKETGENAKTPGVAYISGLWEVTSGECKGFTVWHRVVPGESEFQQARIAQYMQAVCGKNSADVTHDKIEDGGNITKIGTRNPVGVTAGMTFQRKKDTFGVPEGEEPTWKAESNDIIPGWKPKGGGNTSPLPDEVEDAAEEEEDFDEDADDLEEDYEDEEAEEEPAPAPVSRRRKAAPVVEPEPEVEEEPEEEEDDEEEPEDAGEDGDSEDDEDEVVPYETAAAMSLVELKKLAKEYEYEDSELNPFKGPAGKKRLLAKLVEDEIVEAEDAGDEPPF